MTLKEAADLASSVSVVIAAATLVFTLWEHRKRERDKRVQAWQKVITYKIIEDGGSEFTDIKVRYVASAEQFSEFDLPKADIQDGALETCLMQLISGHLISKVDDGSYRVNAVSLNENDFRALAVGQMQTRMLIPRLISRLYETLEVDSGKYTIDQLYRLFQAEQMGMPFEEFDLIVRDKVDRNIFALHPQTQKLWLRGKVPQKL